MDTRRPDPRLARLLQPGPAPDRSASPNPTMDLTIELARTRAAVVTMAAALKSIAVRDRDAVTTSIAEEAIDRALWLMP